MLKLSLIAAYFTTLSFLTTCLISSRQSLTKVITLDIEALEAYGNFNFPLLKVLLIPKRTLIYKSHGLSNPWCKVSINEPRTLKLISFSMRSREIRTKQIYHYLIIQITWWPMTKYLEYYKLYLKCSNQMLIINLIKW